MEYQFVKAYAKSKERGARWLEVDIQPMRMIDIYDAYTSVKVQVDHISLEGQPHHFDLGDVRAMVTAPYRTFSQWLTDIGNLTLPLQAGEFKIENRTVFYRDAWDADFTIEPTRMGSHPETDWPVGEEFDLLLTKPEVDYQDLYQHCLVTVNGFLHRTGYSVNGLYVLDGARSQRLCNDTQVGICSFKDVASLQIVDLTAEMLSPASDNGPLHERAHLNLGVSTEGKSVLLVWGGYLHAFDTFYNPIGDGLFSLNFTNQDTVQRFFEAREVIDLSSLPVEIDVDNDHRVALAQLIQSDEYVRGMANLSQSFAIIVDTPHLYVESHMLEYSGLEGVFYSYQEPTWPLVSQRGRWKEYRSDFEEDVWCVGIDSNMLPNYVFETGPYESYLAVTNQREPSRPRRADRAWLLEIGRDV